MVEKTSVSRIAELGKTEDEGLGGAAKSEDWIIIIDGATFGFVDLG